MTEEFPEIILEMAQLTLIREIARFSENRMRFLMVEPLYQEKLQELKAGLKEESSNKIDEQIKKAVEYLQSKQKDEEKIIMQEKIDSLIKMVESLQLTVEKLDKDKQSQQEFTNPFPQLYETTLFDAENKLDFKFVTIPSKALAPKVRNILLNSDDSLQEVVNLLELGDSTIEKLSVEDLSGTISKILGQEYESENVESYKSFAQYVSYAKVIPFENSPLVLETLTSIVTKVGVGPGIGLIAAVGIGGSGFTPYILITVPAGIVLAGVAQSFVDWIKGNHNPIWSKLTGIKIEQKKKV